MEPVNELEITWFGHSMFSIVGGGVTVVTDPVPPEVGYNYSPVEADLVLVSHDHYDHCYLEGVKGSPVVFSTPETAKVNGLTVEGHVTSHDHEDGQKRGQNTVFLWTQAGVKLAHMGDFGESPSPSSIELLDDTAVVMIPVGGTYTIDADEAVALLSKIQYSVAIPMHYRTADCTIDIAPIDRFTSVYTGTIRTIPGNTVKVGPGTLPSSPEAWILGYR